MNREARTLLLLGLIALVAVVALGGLAQRYRKAFERRDRTTATFANRVTSTPESVPRRLQPGTGVAELDTLDAFLRVRRSLRSAIDGGTTGEPALREVRARTLVETGLSGEAYLEIRGLYRRWKAGGGGLAEEQARRLERLRGELEAVDLGRFEALDL